MSSTVTIPNNWQPRSYQMPLWDYLEQGGKRAVAVWHRRSGKDSTAINWSAAQAVQTPGLYWHMAPTQRQVRKIVWDNIDSAGRRIIDQAFPPAIRSKTNDQEMKIELVNGSIWQCVGSDNYNSLVGANPRGVVFSEYSIADPCAWDYIRPILTENNGWALFIYTPRGRNHGLRLYEMAQHSEGWFSELLTVDDTRAINMTAIEAERSAGMDDDMIQQEFYCSFATAVRGSYYGKTIVDMEKREQVTSVPYDPKHPVTTAWDLGYGDSTAIIFCQTVGRELRVIDYYEASGVSLAHYAQVLKDKGYLYHEHILPHDADSGSLQTGMTTRQILTDMGIKPCRVLPRTDIQDGIQAVRMFLPSVYIDSKKCARLLDALKQYQRVWDEKMQDYKQSPLHDWSSHGADAMRYLAQGYREPKHNTAWQQVTSYRPAVADMSYQLT